MSQVITRRYPTRGSLRGREAAHTVLLRMARDEERADRIRSLKDQRPDLTWAQIAEAVGVTERSAIDWQKTGGISHDNCKKLAKLMKVDPDWLWSGIDRRTPDLMGALGGDAPQLDRIEAMLKELLERVGVDPGDVLHNITSAVVDPEEPSSSSEPAPPNTDRTKGAKKASPPARRQGKRPA